MVTDKTLRPLDGEILTVDKPLGWSSFHVVKKLRGALCARLRKAGIRKLKVGHAGTLDPLATGVMIICTGKSTKRIDELQSGVKEYIATIKLGATTPSFDLETPVDAVYPVEHITRELVEDCLRGFTGRIEQVPPSYSACKVDGDRAYKKARRGEEVELKPKTLVIDAIELLEYRKDEITVRVVCSKGTYIRALARDIGAALGSGGHLTALRRTRVGECRIEDALTIEDAVRMICEQEMTVASESGEELDVEKGEYDGAHMLKERADIKSYAERTAQTEIPASEG
ncbi:MAG: tRNA pseudouridine(55) synthase TruB [Muribaculaceae bacterium]|nr:tRNA pseudouridine(55) synthase TruB [Muribaculaceae bacterium]